MKCCGNLTGHTDACATYWHDRQRQEVEKRVAIERNLNDMVTALGTREGQLMNQIHETAIAEDMLRFYAGCEDEACLFCGIMPGPFGILHRTNCKLLTFVHPPRITPTA